MPESRRGSSIDQVEKTQVEVDEKATAEDHHIQEREPPDGGIAWLILVGCFCGLFSTQGYGYSWGVFLNYYNENIYPNEMTNLTWIGSLWFGLTNITGPVYVYLVGKMGYRWMVGIACVLSALAMMLASITNSVWQLYITQGVMSGIGSSLAWFPCISAPQQWFAKRRGLAVGIAISGSGIGGLMLSNVVQAAIQSVGYQWALRILGFIQFALLAFATAVVVPLNPLPKNVPLMDFKCLKNKQFLILLGIHFIGNFAFYVPSSFVPSYANYMGLDPWIGTNLSAIMSAVMFVGKIGNGFISDYLGRYNMVLICGAMAGIVHLAVWLTATTDASVWAFAVLYGWFGGGYIAMITAVIAQVVGVDQIEPATGWSFFAWFFGGLFGQPISSAIINRTEEPDYRGAIIFSGVLFLFGACLALTLRVMRGGWKIFVKV